MPITLPITPTNLFGNATVTIPLSNLDNNFTQIFNAVDGIGNGSTAIANLTLQGGNVTLSGGTANGGNLAMIGSYLAGHSTVNLNVAGDNPITIQMPTINYIVDRVWMVQNNGTSANATVNVNTGANATGITVASIAQPALSAGINTADNAYQAVQAAQKVNAWVNPTTLYARVQVSEGSPGNGTVYIYASPAP